MMNRSFTDETDIGSKTGLIVTVEHDLIGQRRPRNRVPAEGEREYQTR